MEEDFLVITYLLNHINFLNSYTCIFLKDLAGLTSARCGFCIGQILAALPICGLVFPINLACILPLAGACATCTCKVFAAMLPWIMPICEAMPQAITNLRNSGWNAWIFSFYSALWHRFFFDSWWDRRNNFFFAWPLKWLLGQINELIGNDKDLWIRGINLSKTQQYRLDMYLENALVRIIKIRHFFQCRKAL